MSSVLPSNFRPEDHNEQELRRLFVQLEKASKAGDRDTIALCAYWLQRGIGTEIDLDKSMRLYRLAAEQGSGASAFNLGQYYYQLERYAKAFEWIQVACELGTPRAMGLMGSMFMHGRGTRIDMNQAISAYKRGYAFDDIPSIIDLSHLCRDCIVDTPTIDDVYKKIFGLVESGVKDPALLLELAYYEIDGELVKSPNPLKAMALAKQSADSGYYLAQQWYGEAMAMGSFGVPRNTQIAAKYLKLALDAGSGRAAFVLALLYAAGEGVPRSKLKALEHCEIALRAGETEAEQLLAKLENDETIGEQA